MLPYAKDPAQRPARKDDAYTYNKEWLEHDLQTAEEFFMHEIKRPYCFFVHTKDESYFSHNLEFLTTKDLETFFKGMKEAFIQNIKVRKQLTLPL